MRKRVLFLFILLALSIFTLSSCAAQSLEKRINVVFMYEDEMIASGTVTQFENLKSPDLDESYIPDGYKFFGWTPLDVNKVKATDVNFKEEYIGAGKIVHYMDVEQYAVNTTVVCQAVVIDKAEIPHVYHYAVIAWYDKPATSGIDSTLMGKFETALKAYLSSEGVSEEDLATIVIRGYTGNVGTSCGKIMEDEDVDIMLGWSSRSNVTGTGGMKESMLLETIDDFQVGTDHTRCVHRLTDSETVIKVFQYIGSDACRQIFA